jgi:hypothetical protein
LIDRHQSAFFAHAGRVNGESPTVPREIILCTDSYIASMQTTAIITVANVNDMKK